MKDTYHYKGLRKKLVEELQRKGIHNKAVLNAVLTLPRHFFIEKAFEDWAYQDKPFPIGNEQTISQPFTVAYQTQMLGIKKRDKVLEVGTGSGYQAAILGLLEARVYTVERHRPLYQRAKELLRKLKIGNIRCYHRDGYKGLAEFSPFDKIIVTAGAESVPTPLKEQLKPGGILVIPVGNNGTQKMMKITRLTETKFDHQEYDLFKFVPFLKGLA